METDSAGQDGDDLRIRSHFRREEYYRDEHEQRTEHVHEIRNEVHVIVEYDGLQRCLLADKVINLFADVEDDDDADDEKQRNKECGNEFSDYV